MMLRAGLFAAGALLSTMAAVAAPPAGYQLVWQDDFKAPALDARKWLAYDKLRDSARLTPAAIAVGGGNLRISTYTDNGVQYTGFLTTSGRHQPRFGYFEARIRFQDAPGGHCAFWLQSPTVGKPLGDPAAAGVETDIVEHRATDQQGRDVSHLASFNLHWDGYGSDHKHVGSQWVAPASLDGSWRVYGLLWTAAGYVFYVDGQPRWQSSAAVSATGQDIRLTCEIKDRGWAGPIPSGGYGSQSEGRYHMDVNWVKVWQAPAVAP